LIALQREPGPTANKDGGRNRDTAVAEPNTGVGLGKKNTRDGGKGVREKNDLPREKKLAGKEGEKDASRQIRRREREKGGAQNQGERKRGHDPL